MKIIIDLTPEEYVKIFGKQFTMPTNASNDVKQLLISNSTTVKKHRGRPRKNVEEHVAENTITWLKTKDVVREKNTTHKGGKRLHPNQSRKENKYKFYVGLEFAEKAAQLAGISKRHIYVVRPTASAENYDFYPKFYFIEPNRTKETPLFARGQYVQLWNRNHDSALDGNVQKYISTKRVYTKAK